MRIGELLDELRQALNSCDLCAYIDLDVDLVLSVSAANKPPQEQLDDLAKLASVLLSSNPTPVDDRRTGATEVTSFLSKDRSYFMFRSPSDPSEVICCRCGPDVDFEAVSAGANLTFKWIAEAA